MLLLKEMGLHANCDQHGKCNPADSVFRVTVFEPTQRQLDALANMEAYIQIRSPRTHFTSKAAFADYWKLVSERCDQKTKARLRQQKQPSTDARSAAQKRKTAKDRYYNDQEHLLSYALNYLKRYQPSQAKLQQQLQSKCKNTDIVAAVFAACAPRINDEMLAMGQALQMQQRGKNQRYIKDKLRLRLFNNTCIQKCLEQLPRENGSLYRSDVLEKQVAKLLRKGLSQQAIYSKLCEQAADREAVSAALAACDDQDDETENIRKALARMDRNKLDQQKIIQRLMRKGFRYADIQTVLEE